jgi:hypothetical protein
MTFSPMSRLRRYLVPALLLTPAIFVCGKLLLTPVWRILSEWETYESSNAGSPLVGEYGWPWVYAQRDAPPGLEGEHSTFSFWPLGADLLALSSVVAALGFLLIRHRTRQGRWLRFSLRELLVTVAIAGSLCGWWMYHHRLRLRDRQAAKILGDLNCAEAYCGPEWLARLLPEQMLENFTHVVCISTSFRNDSPLPFHEYPKHIRDCLRLLPYATRLEVSRDDGFEWLFETPVVDEQFSAEPPVESINLSPFEQIEELRLPKFTADDRTLALVARLPRLRSLCAAGNYVTDRGIESLATCRTLEELSLETTNITDPGVAELPKLIRLRNLKLSSTELTDAAIDSLVKIKSLEGLDITHCSRLTDQGVRRLGELSKLRFLAIPEAPQISTDTVVELSKRVPKVLQYAGTATLIRPSQHGHIIPEPFGGGGAF